MPERQHEEAVRARRRAKPPGTRQASPLANDKKINTEKRKRPAKKKQPPLSTAAPKKRKKPQVGKPSPSGKACCAVACEETTQDSAAASSMVLLEHADAFEYCLAHLADEYELRAVKAVSHEFCRAARRVLCSVSWQAAHMSVHELLDVDELRKPTRVAALATRAKLHPEELLKCGGIHRLQPLHVAAINDAPLLVMRALLEAGVQPSVAARRRTRGRLPHHTAALHGARDALAALLHAFPLGASLRDGDGCLPLHLAAAGVAAAADTSREWSTAAASAGGSSAGAAVVAMLLDADSESASEIDLAGMLPLHHATLHCAPLAVVEPLLAAFPAGVCHEARHGWTPLSLAIVYASSIEVFVALLECWPDGARHRVEALACLPLHLAAKHRAPPRVIRLLLSAYPGAAAERDADDRLPLHLAAANHADSAVVSLLLHAYPTACATVDVNAMLPLHLAAQNEASGSVVEVLLHAHPPAARTVTGGDRLPLHLAVANHAPSEAIRALLHVYQHAAAQRTSDGLLPLHVASENGASAAIVSELLAAHPAGARQRTRMGRLPLHLVARRMLIVGADAEDVSSRRSTSGGTASASMCSPTLFAPSPEPSSRPPQPLEAGNATADDDHAAATSETVGAPAPSSMASPPRPARRRRPVGAVARHLAMDSTWRAEEVVTHHELCRHHSNHAHARAHHRVGHTALRRRGQSPGQAER